MIYLCKWNTPLKKPCSCISMTLLVNRGNRMLRNIQGRVCVCVNSWTGRLFRWENSIRFPHQMKFSSTVIGLVMIRFHTVIKLWLLPNMKDSQIHICKFSEASIRERKKNSTSNFKVLENYGKSRAEQHLSTRHCTCGISRRAVAPQGNKKTCCFEGSGPLVSGTLHVHHTSHLGVEASAPTVTAVHYQQWAHSTDVEETHTKRKWKWEVGPWPFYSVMADMFIRLASGSYREDIESFPCCSKSINFTLE